MTDRDVAPTEGVYLVRQRADPDWFAVDVWRDGDVIRVAIPGHGLTTWSAFTASAHVAEVRGPVDPDTVPVIFEGDA